MMTNEKRLIDANEADPRNLAFRIHVDGSEYSAYERGYNDAVISIYGLLQSVPTVDAVEVVHGRWINWGKSGTPTYENYGTCSVCHEDAEICTEHRNYCPNCGAKMDGDGNG